MTTLSNMIRYDPSVAIFISEEAAQRNAEKYMKDADVSRSSWTLVIRPFYKQGEIKGYAAQIVVNNMRRYTHILRNGDLE